MGKTLFAFVDWTCGALSELCATARPDEELTLRRASLCGDAFRFGA
jgi:hypothetical protein